MSDIICSHCHYRGKCDVVPYDVDCDSKCTLIGTIEEAEMFTGNIRKKQMLTNKGEEPECVGYMLDYDGYVYFYDLDGKMTKRKAH